MHNTPTCHESSKWGSRAGGHKNTERKPDQWAEKNNSSYYTHCNHSSKRIAVVRGFVGKQGAYMMHQSLSLVSMVVSHDQRRVPQPKATMVKRKLVVEDEALMCNEVKSLARGPPRLLPLCGGHHVDASSSNIRKISRPTLHTHWTPWRRHTRS